MQFLILSPDSHKKPQKILIKPLQAYNFVMNLWILWHSVISTFFFSLDESSPPEQRTGSMTGGPLTRLDDFTRLLSTSSSSNFFLFIDLRKVYRDSLNNCRCITENTYSSITQHIYVNVSRQQSALIVLYNGN